jgi:hypothetical protein
MQTYRIAGRLLRRASMISHMVTIRFVLALTWTELQIPQAPACSMQWSIIGAIVAVPIPRWFKMKGAARFTPLLALVSAGTIVDYINAFDDGEALRMDLRALDAEVRLRKQRAEAAMQRVQYLQQQQAALEPAAVSRPSSFPGPRKALPPSAMPPASGR